MFKRLIAAGLLAGLVVAASSAFALPTADAVQAEVKQGHYAKAEIMMQEVVAAKPKSARAHYLYAEILAHNKAFDQAAAETAKARELDPAVSFTDPAKFNAFEQLLAREQQAARPKPSRALVPESALINNRPAALAEPSGGGTPGWVWVLGLAAVMAVIWALVSRRQQQQRVPVGGMPMALQPGMGGAPAGYPQAPMGGGFGGMGGSSGPGLMGVGLAAAGGVAAGMLAEKLLHGGSNNPPSYGSAGNLASGNFDDAANNPAARELEQRDVDFGSGAGWDSGGSDNTGGGGDNSAGGSDDW